MPFRFPARRGLLLGALITALVPRAVWAHAILEASEPANDAQVPAGPVSFTFRYNSRIDRARSGLTLTGPEQTKIPLAIDPHGPPNILTTTATLAPGAYVVHWQVLAVDGHITRGDVAFTAMGH